MSVSLEPVLSWLYRTSWQVSCLVILLLAPTGTIANLVATDVRREELIRNGRHMANKLARFSRQAPILLIAKTSAK